MLSHCYSVFVFTFCQCNIAPLRTAAHGLPLQCLQKVSVLNVICGFYTSLKMWTVSGTRLWRGFPSGVTTFSKMVVNLITLLLYYPYDKSQYFNQRWIISKSEGITVHLHDTIYKFTFLNLSNYSFGSRYQKKKKIKSQHTKPALLSSAGDSLSNQS